MSSKTHLNIYKDHALSSFAFSSANMLWNNCWASLHAFSMLLLCSSSLESSVSSCSISFSIFCHFSSSSAIALSFSSRNEYLNLDLCFPLPFSVWCFFMSSVSLFFVGFISSLPQLTWDKRLSCCCCMFHNNWLSRHVKVGSRLDVICLNGEIM